MKRPFLNLGYLQVLDGDLHAGQVHVRNPGARAVGPVTHREHIGERLTHHRFVRGDGGQRRPVTLVGDEARHPGNLVVRWDLDPAARTEAKENQAEAEEEQGFGPDRSSHGRYTDKDSRWWDEAQGERLCKQVSIRSGVSQ